MGFNRENLKNYKPNSHESQAFKPETGSRLPDVIKTIEEQQPQRMQLFMHMLNAECK